MANHAQPSLNLKPKRKYAGQPERKSWLLALLLLLFIPPLMGGTYWMYSQSRREIERQVLQSDLLQARTLSTIVEQDFRAAENILISISGRPSIQREWARRDLISLQGHLQEALKLEPAFFFAGVFDTDGTLRVIEPQDKIVGDNFAYRDWYRGVTTHWQPYVSEVYRTAVTPNLLVVAVAVPIRDETGKPSGILMATYSLSELSRKFKALETGARGEFYVIDQRGVVAASPETNPQSQPVRFSAADVVARALSGAEGSGRFQIDGKNMFVGFAPIPRLGWGVLYAHPESEALAPAIRLRSQNRSASLYLILVYLATAGLAAFLMQRQTVLLSANQVLNRELEKNIAESKRAREELDRYFTLSIDMLCIAGSDGYFKRLNPAWQKTLGHTIEELVSKPYLDFVHPDDREQTIREAEKLGRGLNSISFENRYLCKDGSHRWLSWTAVPFAGGQSIYAVARDITELKQTQEALILAKVEAERSNKFKDQFLSTMSHELRTPLNAVMGFSDLLIDEQYGPLNERQQRYVKHIHTGGHHLLRLINDILDLSKIEAGRLQLSIESVPVNSTFIYVVDAIKPLADKKSHTLVQDTNTNVSVRADSTRLKQILMNLLGNAIKFTPEGGKIEVSAKEIGDVVRMEVHDSGPGISVEDQQRIFEAFYRLGQADKANVEGTGLGLAIARRLVELQGGQLGIESQPGQGSCFYFTLPIAPELATHRSPFQESRAKPIEDLRILVVEDDQAAALLLQSQLISAGYQVVLCDQPENVVNTAAELQPNAITLAVLMKRISGWDLLARLKSDTRTSTIPVIVVTIVDEPAVGALLGADEYIVKPVQKEALLAAVERSMDRHVRVGPAKSILVVEDDTPTREFIAELLSKRGYTVNTAANAKDARAQVAADLPELILLDLILPEASGFQLLAEWRGNPRTIDLPVFVITSKDLTPKEVDYLRSNAGALFRKQEPWQEALIRQLQRVIPPVLIEKT